MKNNNKNRLKDICTIWSGTPLAKSHNMDFFPDRNETKQRLWTGSWGASWQIFTYHMSYNTSKLRSLMVSWRRVLKNGNARWRLQRWGFFKHFFLNIFFIPELWFLMTLLFQMALKTYSKSWDKLRITAGARSVPPRHAAIDAGLYGFWNNKN